jgi:adenylate cyclase
MPPTLKLRVVEKGRDFECDLPPRLELGRQAPIPNRGDLEPSPLALLSRPDGSQRLVVGWNSESELASQQALLEALPDGRVRVTNLSNRVALTVSDLPDPLRHNERAVLTPPFTISLGRRTVHISAPASYPASPQSLTRQSLAPGARVGLGLEPPSFPKLDASDFDQLIDWLQATTGVLQSAVAADDFLARAAEALVTIVQLHSGRVLLRQNDKWHQAQTHRAEGVAEVPELSSSVLRELVARKCSVWQRPTPDGMSPGSLRSIHAVVAAPLLAPDGEVVGALYGEIRRDGPRPAFGDDKLRALLVEMLANAVSGGLARQEVERDRALLRQFFPPELAERLSRDPGLIREGREAEVTVLFCDVRGFSTASERIGPAQTFAWIAEVFAELSRAVQDEQGVLVDYIGDELMAMWGAPEQQLDHAERAARAALAMLRTCEELSRRSLATRGVPTRIGIGLNSGTAQVGNTGSAFKLKYGPLGDAVNVASRIQAMTRYLKCSLLVSGETAAARSGAGVARRVVKARVAGVHQARELYELADDGAGQAEFFRDSEAALDALESRHFAEAAQQAGKLLREHPGDGPLQLILARASQALITDGEGFDPVWMPPGK